MRSVFAALSVAVLLSACAGAVGKPAEVAPLADKGPQFQVDQADLDAAYGYGTVSSELPVESLGSGQTVSLDAAEMQALALEVPVAPGR